MSVIFLYYIPYIEINLIFTKILQDLNCQWDSLKNKVGDVKYLGEILAKIFTKILQDLSCQWNFNGFSMFSILSLRNLGEILAKSRRNLGEISAKSRRNLGETLESFFYDWMDNRMDLAEISPCNNHQKLLTPIFGEILAKVWRPRRTGNIVSKLLKLFCRSRQNFEKESSA
jgi:hypothetical protein